MPIPPLPFITHFSDEVYPSKRRVLFIVRQQFRFPIQNRFLKHIIVIPAKAVSCLHVIPVKRDTTCMSFPRSRDPSCGSFPRRLESSFFI